MKPWEKYENPTPVRFSKIEKNKIRKAAKRDGMKLSSWIKGAVRKCLSENVRIERINDKADQERTT